MIPIEVIIDRRGFVPLRLTPSWDSFRFSTAAIGGFAGASFTLPGDPAKWRREIPHLSIVRIVLDTFTLWEGQVEDIALALGGDIGASVQCFGLQRRLDETSVRRVWSKRDLDWKVSPQSDGGVIPFTPGSGGGNITKEDDLNVLTGRFDITNLTRTGVAVLGTNVAVSGGVVFEGNLAYVYYPGLSLTRVMADVVVTNANFTGRAWAWTGGSTSTMDIQDTTATGALDWAIPTGGRDAIGLGLFAEVNFTPAVTDGVSFENIRILGSTVTEDAAGGIYGGTILRDIISLVPDLSAGMIETGSDFTIQAIERAVRSSARSVVEEVAGYYTREWAVWEDGLFSWETVDRDQVGWMCRVSDLQSGSELTSTVDGLAKTVYILYADAASEETTEASSTATSQRNPYVKQGKTKDLLVQPGFPMTSSTSSQLASRYATDVGQYPSVQGRLVLPALLPVKRANGPSLPALQIRGGDNILISDLPKTELFTTGRDGETLFHVVSTEADLGTGLVTLEVEGQTRRMDVLLARLAEATRVIGG